MAIARTTARIARKLRWALLALAIVYGCGWLLWLARAPERREAEMLQRRGDLRALGQIYMYSAGLLTCTYCPCSGYAPSFTFADVFWCVHDYGPQMAGGVNVTSSVTAPNPFPGELRGKRYGRLEGWPRDMPPDMVPLIWDVESYEGKVPVLFLSGGVTLLTRDELDAALQAVERWKENPERKQLGGFKADHSATDAVRALLASGADPNANDGLGYSVLHWAVLHGDEAAVKLLLEAGADVNAGRVRGYTLLDIAVGRDDEAMVSLLLEAGADPGRAGAVGSTPLHTAARLGNVRMAERLVSAGAGVNVRGSDGRTPLHEAARSGHERMAAWLLEHGADLEGRDERGWTALHFAAFEGRREVVAQLLAGGADPAVRNRDGRTAQDLALKEQHPEVALLLPATALSWSSRARPYLAAAAVVLGVLLALVWRRRSAAAKSGRNQEN